MLLKTGCKLEVPTTSLGSINLLEWLPELRETFDLLDHWCIKKDITHEEPNGRDA